MKRLVLSLLLVASALIGVLAQSYPATFSERQEDPKIVRVFPNPAIDFIHVKVEHAKAENLKLTLHNIIGNETRIESEIVDEHEVRIRVKDLSTGYYLLTIKDEVSGLRTIHKVLKK
jgi:hypothetical protein